MAESAPPRQMLRGVDRRSVSRCGIRAGRVARTKAKDLPIAHCPAGRDIDRVDDQPGLLEDEIPVDRVVRRHDDDDIGVAEEGLEGCRSDGPPFEVAERRNVRIVVGNARASICELGQDRGRP
jgi:hypothetical protein